MRFELTTLSLARLCSTPELRPHSVWGVIAAGRVLCKGGSSRAAAGPKRRRSANAKGRPKGALADLSGLERAMDETRTGGKPWGLVSRSKLSQRSTVEQAEASVPASPWLALR